MTLTPLLKELKEKAIRIEKDPIGEFYCNPRSILFLIQAIEEMKEALTFASIENASRRETAFEVKQVLENYFGSEK